MTNERLLKLVQTNNFTVSVNGAQAWQASGPDESFVQLAAALTSTLKRQNLELERTYMERGLQIQHLEKHISELNDLVATLDQARKNTELLLDDTEAQECDATMSPAIVVWELVTPKGISLFYQDLSEVEKFNDKLLYPDHEVHALGRIIPDSKSDLTDDEVYDALLRLGIIDCLNDVWDMGTDDPIASLKHDAIRVWRMAESSVKPN